MLEFIGEERELLIETLQYRLENDKMVNNDEVLREVLEELLLKVEETEWTCIDKSNETNIIVSK